MTYTLESQEVGRYRAVVTYDDDPMSPREWDNLGTFAAWGGDGEHLADRRVNEPTVDETDEDGYTYYREAQTWCEVVASVYDQVPSGQEPLLALPVQWTDRGPVVLDLDEAADVTMCEGLYYATEQDIRESWLLGPGDPITEDVVRNSLECLTAELKTWAAWAQGEVFCALVLDQDENVLDACGEFYDTDDAVGEAVSMAELFEGKAAALDAEDATHGVPMFIGPARQVG